MLMITGYRFDNKVYLMDDSDREQMYNWLSDNVKYEDFTYSTSLIYSFKHAEDCIAFKLRFGL